MIRDGADGRGLQPGIAASRIAWLAGGSLVIAALGAGSWWSRRDPGPVRTAAATIAATGSAAPEPRPGDAAGARPSHARDTAAPSPPTRVIRLPGGADDRRRIAQQIAAASSARRAAATAAGSIGSGATPPPGPSTGSAAMDSPQHVMAQMLDALEQVKGYVAECAMQSDARIAGFKAALSLTGDPDIGTLIDASGLDGIDDRPLPAQFDDCVRGIMQTLELPAMAVGDEFKVDYEFTFD
jgi:hypothetical protein